MIFAVGLPVYPALHFWAENRSIMPTETGLLLLGGAVATGLLLSLLLYVVVRPYAHAAAVAGVIGMLLGLNAVFRAMLDSAGVPMTESIRFPWQLLIHALVLLAGLLVYQLLRWKPDQMKTVGVFSALLVLLPPLSLLSFSVSEFGARDRTVHEQKRPGASPKTPDETRRPHIIITVFDAYGRADLLQRMYGYDNTPFVDSLRSRGFFIADSSCSNYAQTILSMTSMFRMRHLTDIADEYRGSYHATGTLQRTYQQAPAWDILRSLGYRLVISDFIPFLTKRDADVYLGNAITEEMMLLAYLQQTSWVVIQRLLRQYSEEQINGPLDWWLDRFRSARLFTERYAHHQKPVFMLSHFFPPHPPFILGQEDVSFSARQMLVSDGSRFHRENGTTPAYYRDAYRRQVDALNPIILDMVDEILSSDRPLIFIIMSDHGPGSEFDEHSIRACNPTERLTNFFALYSTEGMPEPLSHSITPVNIFPLIFNTYFGMDVQLQENRSYLSTWSDPLELVDVTEAVRGVD